MYMHPEVKIGELELDLNKTIKSLETLSLSSLMNVDARLPVNDEVLTFDAATGKWVPKPPTGGGSSSSSPSYLVDLAK